METFIIGEYDCMNWVHGKRIAIPMRGKIVSAKMNGESALKVYINGNEKQLPAQVECGDLIGFKKGDIIVLQR
jgi:hypothetical protein